MQKFYGSFVAALLSGFAWVFGQVMYVVLRAVYRGEPKAIAILVSAAAAIAALVLLL